MHSSSFAFHCPHWSADSSAARHNGYKVFIVDAPFPSTLAVSALGVTLTDAQLQHR